MSNVYWAFKNSFKDFNTITFEGPVIQCIDLKRAILQKTRTQNKEIDQLNYGLTIHNAQTGEEYRNDAHYINRNTSVIVKRVPVRSSEIQKLTIAPQIKLLPTIVNGVVKKDPFGKDIYGGSKSNSKKTTPDLDVEKSKIFEVMKATAPARHDNDDHKYRQKGHWKAKGSKPPSNYTCFTCNTPGHWIWDCPKKNDPVKSVIEKPPIQEEETNYLEIALKRKHGLLDEQKEKNDVFKPYSCSLCKQLYRKPTLTPCCKFTYCDECIRQYLIENHRYTCPSCEERIKLDDLTLNITLHKKIQEIKEKLGDPKAEPNIDEIQAMFPARNFQPNTFNDLRVDPISITCLHCGESGHMFKDCPKKCVPIVKDKAEVKPELPVVDVKPTVTPTQSLPTTLLQNLPNLLTNPVPAALPTGLPLPGIGALNGGLHGGSHLPSLSTFLYMQKLMKKQKKKSRSGSRSPRERRRRRDRRRRRSRSYSSSRDRSDSRGRSRRDRGRRRRRRRGS